MKTLALVFLLATMTAHATEFVCNPIAKARATAIVALESSDRFIPADGEPTRVKHVRFDGVIGPSRPNEYLITLYFGSKDQNAGMTMTAYYVIGIDPETCEVRKTELVSVQY